MSTVTNDLGGDVIAVSFTGLGTGLTDIQRANIAVAAPNTILVNDGTGLMSSIALLDPARGGTGIDTSALTGLVKVTGGVWSAGSAALSNADLDPAAAIDRAKLAAGAIDQVVINNSAGVMTSEAQLSVLRGGTGQNFTAVVGPVIPTIAAGVYSATLGYATTATASTIAQRDGSGALAATSITAPGDLTLAPAGSNILLGNKILRQVPSVVIGGFREVYTVNLQTVGAVATPLFVYATVPKTAYAFDVVMTSLDTASGNTGATKFIFKAKNPAGVLTTTLPAGATTVNDAGFAPTFTTNTSGVNVRLMVTGVVSLTIRWMARIEVISQNAD